MTGGQTIAWVLGQGFLIAWVSAAVAAVAGTALSWVLANVIQYRSFGWSIPTHPQAWFWLEAMGLATAAALVAAAYPIVRLRRWGLASSLRQE
jgi:putative ABC transport system permease protein